MQGSHYTNTCDMDIVQLYQLLREYLAQLQCSLIGCCWRLLLQLLL